MFAKKMLCVAVAGAIGAIAPSVLAGTIVDNRAVEIVGPGATADPLIAVEANRGAIINRLAVEHAATLTDAGISSEAFRNALSSLRADQLLAASLVNSVAEITAIVSAEPINGSALQRFVALSPREVTLVSGVPTADAYLVRDGDALIIVKAAQLQPGQPGVQLVGYFATANDAVASNASAARTFAPKDGSGSGSGSWIGYVSGGNQASGTSSAVAAGSNNLASGQNAFVGAGFANQANGTSSLVIGGFDNRATNIDALVGAGAGNRATGARSVIVGGGYNLASGNFSFIGGGGRDGTGSTAAGTDVDRDHRAFGKWSFIGGGTGNVTGVSGSGDAVRSSAVAGGARNTASGAQAFIGAGGCNVASGVSAVVAGGGQTADTGACTFGNVASGNFSFIGGGFANIAAGSSSVALGQSANAAHSGSFVFSDGTSYSSNGTGTFNVEASGGMFVSPTTRIQMGSQTRQNITLWGGADEYGIGVQSGTQYFRSGSAFAWFQGGTHDDNTFNPGTGGTRVLTLEQDSSMTFGTGGSNGEFLKLNPTNNRAIGSQSFTLFFRSNSDFCWYRGGTFSGSSCDPGAGGVLAMSLTSGGLTVNGTFVSASDRNRKTSIQPVDVRSILAKVAALPISSWAYKADAGTPHIGPMAQDFKRLFNVGTDDKTISMVDADGIALAAIKGLNELVKEKDAKISKLEREMMAIKKKLGM